ncbi:hypothetical protein TL16_g07192 [Triparma laevis f. inornata]|uniref:Uncharacterized protein n=1 Tax=Triparma laevis f. inornata TaxID=1714386 RepID=A0A9W7AXE3_9STRA|nr:hypothetical protein TL16_g07192 [Triparma laevis f. inornata]
MFIAGLTGAANFVYPGDESLAATTAPPLQFLPSPYNIRTSTTLYDAEKTYPLPFVTYLTRLLLTYDPLCRTWYTERAKGIRLNANEDEVFNMRLDDFGKFSASVDLGLRDYLGVNGPGRLFESLEERFAQGKYGLEARRQIVLLFSLMKTGQPSVLIERNLDVLENATVKEIRLTEPGTAAYVKSNLTPSGRILRIDVISSGSGYTSKPVITVESPRNGSVCVAQGFIKDGGLQRVEVVEEGGASGTPAVCVAVPELIVTSLQIIDPGYGYPSNKTLTLKIDPPPITSRINLNKLPDNRKTQSLINKLGNNATGCIGESFERCFLLLMGANDSKYTGYTLDLLHSGRSVPLGPLREA